MSFMAVQVGKLYRLWVPENTRQICESCGYHMGDRARRHNNRIVLVQKDASGTVAYCQCGAAHLLLPGCYDINTIHSENGLSCWVPGEWLQDPKAWNL